MHTQQPDILVRAAAPDDVPACAAIEAQAADGWSPRGIEDALRADAARCFVCMARGRVAAFCAFTLAADEANLDTLTVDAGCRRQGLARQLLGTALQNLAREGAARVFLEVRSANTPARALYEKLGFRCVGLRRGFYRAPADDAVLMEKVLI